MVRGSDSTSARRSPEWSHSAPQEHLTPSIDERPAPGVSEWPSGDEATRQAIIAAAREAFAKHGHQGLDCGSIARSLGVDPALIGRIFASREELLLATLRLPDTFPQSGDDGSKLSGEQIVLHLLRLCETGDNGAILEYVLRESRSDRRARVVLESYLTRAIVRPLADSLHVVDALPRVRLVMSHLIGLIVSRYALHEEPLASSDAETIAAWMGPALDHYLHGSLSGC